VSHDRRTGLRLSELLALAIIAGVLSCLLFPVFARSQARMAVCLGNIRTIARAFQMYLGDNDSMFPPREVRPEILAYFNSRPGGGDDDMWNPNRPDASPDCHRSRLANPYLRRPVILDCYLPSRAVWRCPSARLEGGASFINRAPDWLAHLQNHHGEWGMRSKPRLCPGTGSFPLGWGGEVTDSIVQRRLAVPTTGKGRQASAGMFVQSIGVTEAVASQPMELIIEDPSWFIVCADAGATVHDFCPGTLAYPDLCGLECAGPGYWEADWENCPWSQECGAIGALKTDPALRQPYARHFGGVNIGFLDGHARWMHSEQVLAEVPSHGDANRGRLRGAEPRGPTRDAPWYDRADGIPPLY